MDFDKSRVFTSLNASAELIGAKGFFADSLHELIDSAKKVGEQFVFSSIEDGFIRTSHGIRYNFFYLVEPALVVKYRPFKNIEELFKVWADKTHSIPANMEKFVNPLIWVADKDAPPRKEFFITRYDFDHSLCIRVDGNWISLEELFKYYTFLDGSPCGV